MKKHLASLAGLAALGFTMLAYAGDPGSVSRAPSAPITVGNGDKPSIRQREGTQLVEVLGKFKVSGDRVIFYTSEGNQRYGGLENLNLERIALLVGENPDELEWCVSGEVTEYRGSNYLLVTKAMLKNKPAPSDRSERRTQTPASKAGK